MTPRLVAAVRPGLALLLCSLALVPLAAASVGVTLQVDPHVALPPADIRVTVRVLADPANAYVVVSCDGPAYYGSSAIPLRADLSTLEPIWFRKLPAGTYLVLAALYRTQADGRIDEVGRAEARVIVVDP